MITTSVCVCVCVCLSDCVCVCVCVGAVHDHDRVLAWPETPRQMDVKLQTLSQVVLTQGCTTVVCVEMCLCMGVFMNVCSLRVSLHVFHLYVFSPCIYICVCVCASIAGESACIVRAAAVGESAHIL